jgi:hypothetical protein
VKGNDWGMNDRLAFLITAPNEPIALMWQDMLRDAGIPALVRPGGPGAGAWGSVATFEHELYVRDEDLERARQIVAEEDDS